MWMEGSLRSSREPVQAVVAHGAHDLRVEEVPSPELGPLDAEVGVVVGGICGSDLHYYHEGGVGDFMIRQPLVLGHEIAGTVLRVGEGAELTSGERVVIDPSSSCGLCPMCRRGRPNLCSAVQFLGSAAHFPHVQGGFRQRLITSASNCVPVPDGLPLETAVMSEPLAVAVHAVVRAGTLIGRRVLVTGAGPIGLLIALVASRAGASAVIVTDIESEPLERAARVGATQTVHVTSGTQELDQVDAAFEASGAPPALASALRAVRPGGQLVVVGLPPGLVPIPAGAMITREVDVTGSFRFDNDEFRAALTMLANGLDVSPLLTGRFPLKDAVKAFDAASDRSKTTKVQLTFN
jgi:L-idonate 5-dehydrogenase